MANPFIGRKPTLEDLWRAIVLYGRNVASYKFALASSLLELRPEEGDLVRLEDLSGPFSRHLMTHLARADKQATSPSSKFLDALRMGLAGELSEQQVIEQTTRLGFVNVIDAFHVVGSGDVPQRFFLDERPKNGGIRITEDFSRLAAGAQFMNLPGEAESRWRLVETAWGLGVSPTLLRVLHDEEGQELFVFDKERRRQSVSSARDALNGYQKGHCFYCFGAIDLTGDNPPDVDHFFPHVLKFGPLGDQVDGVWNLTLACRSCNRGTGGKFARIPSLGLLGRLHQRNEYLIMSHHPLRETLIGQTGKTVEARTSFLSHAHDEACRTLVHTWQPEPQGPDPFGPDV